MEEHFLKICYICKSEKDKRKDFNKNISKKDKLQSHCIECGKNRSKKYYNGNKEYHKKVISNRKNKHVKFLRQYVYDYYIMHGCIDCNEKDPIVLEFDHVSGEKISNICKMAHSNVSLSRLIKEIEKCVVRCANCHRRKTAKDQNWYKDLIILK